MAYTVVHVYSDTIKGTSAGKDEYGRFVATRTFKVVLSGSGTYSDKMVAILGASGIPVYGTTFFSSLPSGYTQNPYANNYKVTPDNDNDPLISIVEVSYGYKSPITASQDDDIGDEPDVDRERYPWENNADIAIDIGNSREVVPEGGGYGGWLTLAQVASERGTAGALSGINDYPFKALVNTANDPFKDPPTKLLRSGTITISFSVVDNTKWKATSFLDNFLFAINAADFTIGDSTEGSVTGTFTAPAGTAQVVGFNCVNKTYTESKKWRPGKDHPFAKEDAFGSVFKNTTKAELTAYRYTPYYDITIKMEFKEDGFVHYIQNLGMRQLVSVAVPNMYENGEYIGPGTVTIRAPIKDAARELITEPKMLNATGVVVPDDSTDAYFLKYSYYYYAEFAGLTGFISDIPWVPEVVLESRKKMAMKKAVLELKKKGGK